MWVACMSEADEKKRQFLVGVSALVAGVGVVGAAVPLVHSLSPSRSTLAAGAPVRVDVSKMNIGEQKTVMWRGKPIWIVRRAQEQVERLLGLSQLLRDPDSKVEQQPTYAANDYRSVRPEFLVLVGVCTHLGCAPTYRPEPGSVESEWPGGFYCSCHGSKFDLAGRVFKGVPAPINLEVPPYHFADQHMLVIGEDGA